MRVYCNYFKYTKNKGSFEPNLNRIQCIYAWNAAIFETSISEIVRKLVKT